MLDCMLICYASTKGNYFMTTLAYNEFWQTQARGTNDSEYQLYLDLANDGNGLDITTGKPLKSYDEWLNS